MTDDISLSDFRSMDEVKALQTYVDALVAFDAIEQMQELKRIERALVTPSSSILDVGCGFGLETERLARLVAPGQPISPNAEPRRRGFISTTASDLQRGCLMPRRRSTMCAPSAC
jgi:ubiquinone/menaquinone biosynthesis C-methylase UbiE